MCSSRGDRRSRRRRPRSRRPATTRTPQRSPASIASATPPIVSWSDSASSSTPASAAFCTTSAGGSEPSEAVECDCRSKRGGTRRSVCDRLRGAPDGPRSERGRRVMRTWRWSAAAARRGWRGEQPRDARFDAVAQAAHGRVVAVRLLRQRSSVAAAERVAARRAPTRSRARASTPRSTAPPGTPARPRAAPRRSTRAARSRAAPARARCSASATRRARAAAGRRRTSDDCSGMAVTVGIGGHACPSAPRCGRSSGGRCGLLLAFGGRRALL